MIIGMGIDMMTVARMDTEMRSEDRGFRDQIFTPGEIAYCEEKRYPARHYAARFAAKEALFKALPPRDAEARSFREIEIRNMPGGAPEVVLHGKIGGLARSLRVSRILVSLSHTEGLAAACVVLES